MSKLPVITLMSWIFVIGLTGCTPLPEESGVGTLVYEGGDSRSDAPVVEDDQGKSDLIAIVEYKLPDFTDPQVLEKYARADLLVMVPNHLWAECRNSNAIQELKSLNPELKILGYFNSQTTFLNWEKFDEESNPYKHDWYQRTKPYWSYTTEGDTAMAWVGKVVLNILEEECREAIVDVIQDHWYAHGNVFDGIFWDHFNTYLWTSSSVPNVEGGLDLDGDGIIHTEDEDEMEGYRMASTALVEMIASRMGDDVIQVCNGNRAAKDSVFAGLVDGMMYENFPDVGFSGNEMENSLDPLVYNNLFAARNWPRKINGGPFLLLTNRTNIQVQNEDGEWETWRRADFNRIVALLTGNYVTYNPFSETYTYDWPEVSFNLGAPVSIATHQDGRIRRDFQNGFVELDFQTEGSNAPFHFRVEENNNSSQRFRLHN